MTQPEQLICIKTKTECTDESIDAAPDYSESETSLSDIAEVITKNYGKYHELVEKHIGLQSWIREQEKITNGTTNSRD